MTGPDSNSASNKAMSSVLDGLLVLDLSTFQQGPLGTALLGDFGARVVKVESPHGDPARGALHGAVSPAFIAHNRGKESITLNLTTELGREALYKLVANADVVVQNFLRPVAEKLHVTYEKLRAVNPKLVYVWATGYGPMGPKVDDMCMDIVMQAYGGLASVTGEIDGRPLPVGATVGDNSSALQVLSGALLGLLRRQLTGEGCEIGTSLYGTSLALQSWEITHAGLSGEVSKRGGTGHPVVESIYGLFDTSDGHIAMAGLGDIRWPNLCIVWPDLKDNPRFLTAALRQENLNDLREIINERLRAKPSAYWLKTLQEADVVSGPVQNYQDILRDEQAWAAGYLQKFEDPDLGVVTGVAAPIAVNGEPAHIKGGPPQLGQHTELILLELGYTWDDIAAFKDAAAV